MNRTAWVTKRTLYLLTMLFVSILLMAQAADAKTVGSTSPVVKQFTAAGTLNQSFTAFSSSMKNGVRLAVGDTDGDGQPNIVTATGQNIAPQVRVYTSDGTLVSAFSPYATAFRGGVHASVYDLDGDGRAEIITAPGTGGGPDIKIFSQAGTLIRRFFAFDQKFRGGASVSAHAFGRNGEPLIAVGSGYGSGHVRLFNPNGEFTGLGFFPYGKITHGLTLAALPVPGGRSKLLIGPERSERARVQMYNLSDTDQPEREIVAFPSSFRGGVHLAAGDIDGDGISEIVVAAGAGGGPHVKIFEPDGIQTRNFFAYAASFRGGVYVATAGHSIFTSPGAIALDGRTDLHKYVEIDLSDQSLKYFQAGRLLGTRRVSTGKWTTPTPIGTHTVKNKVPIAYSKPYNLYMEWWMAFTPDGSYGLHALPFWKTAGGGKYYEGAGHLGTPVSHGCIRQTLAEAKSLFQWADIGTTVIVKR